MGLPRLTRQFVEAVSGTKARILDTRKTAPGLRMLDKYAVRCGGAQNHRLDLSDGVLIKHNHIALAGGIVPALERAHKNRRGEQIIEVEVRSSGRVGAGVGTRRRGHSARQHVGRRCEARSRALFTNRVSNSVGSLRRNHPGERARLRRNWSEFYFSRDDNPLGESSGYEHAPGAGVTYRHVSRDCCFAAHPS